MNWLLVFIPATVALEHLAPERHLLVFFAAAIAILPLAGWLGRATEQLAERMGEGVGGLLNATFGNAAELIIALAALRAGLHDVVKASIAGSIVGNILLVLGAAMLAGGMRRSEQLFNASAARSQATMLMLAAIALVLPAAYRSLLGEAGLGRARDAEHRDLDSSPSCLRTVPPFLAGHPCLLVRGNAAGGGGMRKRMRRIWSSGLGRGGARCCHRLDRLDERDPGAGDRADDPRVRPE